MANQTSDDNPLSQDDLNFFDENGYVVLHNAVPAENCDAVVKEIWNFIEMDPQNPNDWYHSPVPPNGMVELYHHQSLWNNRQHPRVYGAFKQLWNTSKLWVSLDRVAFKPPVNKEFPNYRHQGFVHWDSNPWMDMPYGLQGVLSLEDTQENQGGFHCVPGMHKYLTEWIKMYSPLTKPIEQFHTRGIPINCTEEMKKEKRFILKKIPMKKGDLLMWRRELAHGNGLNEATKPRLAQYISMFPARAIDHHVTDYQECQWPEGLSERVNAWRERLSPGHKPGDSRSKESKNPAAELTDLGKKLLGLVPWDEEN